MLTRRNLLQMAASLAAGTSGRMLAVAQSLVPQSAIDADPLRPRYHLMPRRGWMNDPCAPVYYRGRYHLFFQYNPGASVWGDMHWAHAVSTDMLRWSFRPIALAPTPGGPDAYGVFTGSMTFNHGIPTILYTCVSPSTQALATLWGSNPPEREQQCLAAPAHPASADASAALDYWIKQPQPVISSPPEGMKVTGFRDPVPWQEPDGTYYMLLASGQKGVGGNVLLYQSANLREWQFQHIFAEGQWTGKQTNDTVDSGEMWECPDFFELNGKHVLIHSTGTADGRKTLWQSGTLDRATMRWTPEQSGLLNHGPYYAPKTQLDAAGRRVLWGWIEETRPQAEYAKAGWAGCMSLPRVLTLQDGKVCFAPTKLVDTLRGSPSATSQPEQMELILHVAQGSAGKPVQYASPTLTVKSGGDAVMWNGARIAATLPEQLTVRCFVDHSVVEVFLGDAAVLTARVYGGQPARLVLPAAYNQGTSTIYPLHSTS